MRSVRTNVQRPVIVWFRRDLRTDDNPALFHAAAAGLPVVPVFIFDTGLLAALPSDGALFDFQAQALRELGDRLATLGAPLVIRRGNIVREHRQLLAELQPAALYYNRDCEPAARERDQTIDALYTRHGIEVRTFKESVAHEPGELFTSAGKPYVVFTPYGRAWKRLPAPPPDGHPRRMITIAVHTEPIADAHALKRSTTIPEFAFTGGVKAARHRWHSFLHGGLAAYGLGRDIPSIDGTSRLSPFLRFGCIAVARLLHDLESNLGDTAVREGAEKFRDELIWREFYKDVLFHHPHLLASNYRSAFDQFPWRVHEREFTAWREGRTGIPIVDAGMRQLNATGWMHNRVRMIVASFLVKDMHHDWRLGQSVFEQKLADIETASNNGGWQWSASTGVDPKPLRIFNPYLQSRKFDPDGLYIKTWIPELKGVPPRFIHAPHEMPPVLQKELGCVVGRHYPAPIVDHARMARLFKERYLNVTRRD